MFIKKVNLALVTLCTIFFQGILSLELYSEERINQWKVDIVIEKKPTEELIKSRKAELDEKIRREREAAEKEGNKENGKILGGLIDRINEDDEVEFELKEGRKGMNAINVKVIQS